MRICSAHFSNFRALRDVEILFSTDDARRLTVIRAENGTGKTSALLGLQWAFFGDEGLPKGGRGVRLFPLDWDAENDPQVEIAVEVSFIISQSRARRDGNFFEEDESYVVRRSCTESAVTGDRSRSNVALLKLADGGYRFLENPRVVLEDLLPSSLREVFFTDGDRAKTFVDSDISQTAKRARVAGAVRSLLGLDLLEDASAHARDAVRSFQGSLGKGSGDELLNSISQQLMEAQDKVQEKEVEVHGLRGQEVTLNDTLSTYETQLAEALVKGDREELTKEFERYSTDAESARTERSKAAKAQSSLLHSDELFKALVAGRIGSAGRLLANLKETGAIPKTFLPFVQGQLATGRCICGSDLSSGTGARQHVEHLIAQQQSADDVTDRLTTLQVLVQRTLDAGGAASQAWSDRMISVTEDLERAEDRQRIAEGGQKEVRRKIDQVSDADVGVIRNQISITKEQLGRVQRGIGLGESDLRGARRQVDQLEVEQARLAKLAGKYLLEQARLTAARDVVEVLDRTVANIQRGRLVAVSESMNRLFLDIIGVDRESRSLVMGARITDDHDIEIVGPEGRLLDPQLDLNGASQRALTLALVLALANVSGVSAPNVIDTPLGMTSDNVRSSMVRVGAEQSTQLVLFLTRAEIQGVENLLDSTAGAVVTLTNTQHWPERLVNEPAAEHLEVITCECSHRQYCVVCERADDRDSGLVERLA